MAKFQSPLLGYNNNVRHKNRQFHIQTEDSGVNHPHIITHLFMDGGRILKSVKKSYAEHVGVDGMSDTVRGLMKEQHKAMFIALRDGQFDHLVDPGAAAAAVATAAAKAATAAALAATSEADAAAATDATASGDSSAVVAIAAASAEIIVPIEEATAEEVAAAEAVSAVEVVAAAASIEFARADAELQIDPPPNTIEEPKRPPQASVPPPASAAQPKLVALPPPDAEDIPVTTRQPPEVRKSPSGRELTLDFDALELAAQDAVSPSLFHSSDLPPPPKNLFAKEPTTGGAYRAVEADPRHYDAREEPGRRADPRAEPASRGGHVERHHIPAPPPSTRGEKSPQPGRVSNRPVGGRPGAEARYAPARPAAIFGSTQRPPPQSLFSDELVSDKSLDEVILSYLAEDLDPPNRK